MARKQRMYFTIPLPLMEGWWESYESFQNCLLNGLQYDILAYTYECNFTNVTDDETVIKAVHESFNLKTWRYDNENHIIKKMRQDKVLYNLYWTEENNRPANFQIEVRQFWDFVNNEKTMDDCSMLMAFMSVKSLMGHNKVIKTNKYAITARMACRTSLRSTSQQLPEEIAKWQSRKRYDRLKRVLFERYHVGFYSDTGIRGTYATQKKNENGDVDLPWLIDQATKIEQTMSAKKDPLKEAIKKAKLQHLKRSTPTST